jgi:hypothetical protein
MSLVRRFQYVEELDRELKQHDKAEPAWKSTNIAQTVFADLTLQRRCRQRGRVTWRVAASSASPTSWRSSSSASSRSSTRSSRARRAPSSRNHSGTADHPGPNAKRAEEIRVDDEHHMWPFTGEYWRDELGYYRVRIGNKCQHNAPRAHPRRVKRPLRRRGRPPRPPAPTVPFPTRTITVEKSVRWKKPVTRFSRRAS